jgi:hypothetical protein
VIGCDRQRLGVARHDASGVRRFPRA